MAFIWEDLSTEQPNSQHVDLDLYDSQTILALMNEEDQSVPRAIGLILPDIARAVDAIVPRLQSGGRLIYIGAGTSGRLGVLDAVECPPTYSVSPSLIQGIIAGGNESMFIAAEGAEDDEGGAASDLKNRQLTERDVVMGISASGRTDAASSLLDSAGGSVKLAIVMWESGVDRAEAERRLNAANGFVREVVSNNRPSDETSSS